jgi:TonB family protein
MALLLVANKVTTGYPRSVVLESGQIIIGRLTTNHLVLPGGSIEPIHAMVETDPETGLTTLVDMASESGVLLNGRRIDVSASVKVGDKITIGDITIELSAAPQQEAGKSPQKDEMGPDTRAVEVKVRQPRVVSSRLLFTAEKDRRSGSTLEVVAFWDQSILDVRHYGGEQIPGDEPRSNKVILGNEHEGDLIGVGPKANTRNLKLADVRGSKAVVHLNDEMRARIRRGARFDQVKGPAEVQLAANDMALIQHGTISYFMTRVSLPRPVLKKIDDVDGKPIIFAYAAAIYVMLALLIGIANANNPPQTVDDDAWATQFAVRTPTPRPTDKPAAPAPKPTVAIKTPAPEKKSTPPPAKPKPTKPMETVATPKPAQNNQKPTLNRTVSVKPPGPAAGEKQKTKDPFLGPKNDKTSPGNAGGKRGGTSGAYAGQRQGADKSSMMGVEGGKKDELGGLNLDALGSDIGKTINAEGAGKIAIGVKANGGGLGAGSGSGKRGSMGLGGIGESNSISSGGPGDALKGLGAGGFGAGGSGAGGRRDAGGGSGKIVVGSVSAPAVDSVLEGNLSKDEIEAVIRANLAKIKACYERQLQFKRGLQGRVMSKFVINPDGRVSTASISQSELRDGATETCISNEIRRWKFPLPRGGGQVSVSYPFVFTPSS